MVWQDGFSGAGAGGRTDPEEEREARLAAQVRAGAEWALAALVARYQPPVSRYLTRLTGDTAAARRSAEQIFVRMERRVRGPQGGHNLRLWLLRAATEAGLEYLRTPAKQGKPQLEQPRPAGLLPGTSSAAQRLKAGLGSFAARTSTTGHQVRSLIFPAPPAPTPSSSSGKHRRPQPPLPPVPGDSGTSDAEAANAANEADPYGAFDPQLDTQDARTELHHHLVRAVLSELPYGDAQCLALHLVAGLNQAQVARALGITPSAARRRIVQGLQLFAQRYEAATASLPPEVLAESEATEAEYEIAAGYAAEVSDVPTVVLDHPLSRPASDEEPAPSEPTPVLAAEGSSEPGEPEPLIVEEEPEPVAAAPAPEPRPEIVVDATPPAAGSPPWADPPDIAPTVDPFVFDTPAAKTPAPPDTLSAASAFSVVDAIWQSARHVPTLTPIALPAPQVPPESPVHADALDALDALDMLPAALSHDHADAEESEMPAADEASIPSAPAALPRQVPVLTEAAKPESATSAAAPRMELDSGLPRADGHQADGHQADGHQADGHQADGHQADGHQDTQDDPQAPRYVPVLSGEDEGVAALSAAHAPGDERPGGTV